MKIILLLKNIKKIFYLNIIIGEIKYEGCYNNNNNNNNNERLLS